LKRQRSEAAGGVNGKLASALRRAQAKLRDALPGSDADKENQNQNAANINGLSGSADKSNSPEEEAEFLAAACERASAGRNRHESLPAASSTRVLYPRVLS
jgi:hypothetical protein